jgi:pimeloyl-ACP methyl ester carboxylesterase
MKLSFQRIITDDGLELHGLLYEPDKKTTDVLIHIHGWVGNFYENKFIDDIAKEVTQKGFALLTFNNRGAGIITDFTKRKKTKVEYIRIGGSLEKFEDCIYDIKASIDFLLTKGYKKIILQGHSLGCQKTTFYLYKTRDKRIKGLVLLAPVDDLGFAKEELGKNYEKSLKIARKMIKDNKADKPVPELMSFYPLLSADMFLNVADPASLSGRLFNYAGELKEVQSISCPTFAVFGSKDEYQLNSDEKLNILKRKIKNCSIKLIKEAGHGFVGFEEALAKSISNWIKTL